MASDRTRYRRIESNVQLMLSEMETDVPDVPDVELGQPVISNDSLSELQLVCDSDYANGICLGSDKLLEHNMSNLSIKDKLAKWAVENNITSTAVDSLLNVLSEEFPSSKLPKSYKTLLGTPTNYNICTIAGGYYYHFGLRQKLQVVSDSSFCTLSKQGFFSITIGIDGVPISKSSKKQFWPILGRCPHISNNIPFLIGLYYGEQSKPIDVNEFLGPLVNEFLELRAKGVNIYGVNLGVRLRCIIADAPARNYVKQTAAFNGFHGCDRCTLKGAWFGRVVFNEFSSPLRTDKDFNDQLDKLHHHGTSPLVPLNFGLVSCVVLDYMHLICLGVVKKLLKCWKSGPLPHREGRQTILIISEKLVRLNKYAASEFNRRPRSLSELEFWKATEFRSFLLYYGPVVLKDSLSPQKYKHFLKLSIATRILLSNNRSWYPFARHLFFEFGKDMSTLYCKEFLVYNVHSLVHITDDADIFGSLETINAFAFENDMQTIKRMIRGNSNHLAQVIRRIGEKERVKENAKIIETISRQFKISDKPRDRGFILQNNDIVVVISIEGQKIRIRKFKGKSDYFTDPCKSTKFMICKVTDLSFTSKLINEFDIKYKVMLFPIACSKKSSYICVPLCEE